MKPAYLQMDKFLILFLPVMGCFQEFCKFPILCFKIILLKNDSIVNSVANWSPKLSEEDVVNEMKRAFTTWSGYGRLHFHHIQDPNADITIAFGRGPHQDG
jgi:hypothetical protein